MLKLAVAAVLIFSGILQQLPSQLIDNERVTVWEASWTKGKPTAGHTNKFDQVVVELANASIRVTMPDGRSQTSALKFGQVTFVAKGDVPNEEVSSGIARHAIVIDLKEAVVSPLENKSGYPDAFPRDGARKVLDNGRVTVWDYSWTRGKPTPMHFHSKDVVTIYMVEGEIRSTALDGTAVVNVIRPGLAKFNPRNRTHTEELIKGAGRAIIVELK